MADVDDEIREIKREIIESRALVIKTSNVLSALAADVKSIAKRQATYERRISWNSWVAYILFAALSFFGLYLANELPEDQFLDEHFGSSAGNLFSATGPSAGRMAPPRIREANEALAAERGERG